MKTLTESNIVFIYGALRSGTTVFRLMLDAHSKLSNPGEMDFLFDYLHPDPDHKSGWRYDLEALSQNRIFRSTALELRAGLDGADLLQDFFAQLKERAPSKAISINLHRNIDRVTRLLPEAPILHILRDPRDVARSTIKMGWAGTLYHGVRDWIETEQSWTQSASHLPPDQTLEITFETLFQNVDATLRQACAFLQVPFEENMLQYHLDTTYAPPDPTLTEQWKRTANPQELAQLESRAGPLMEARGYTRSQPPRPLSSVLKAKLSVQNKLNCWAFGMKRFGPILYWGEKLTRRAGPKTTHHQIVQRMQSITTQHLK